MIIVRVHESADTARIAAEAIVQGATLLRREGFLGTASSVENVALSILSAVKEYEEGADDESIVNEAEEEIN